MVKAGLVRRTRDMKDRRAVFVSITDKGREAVEPAFPAGWDLIHKALSPLSYDEQRALASMLEKVKCVLLSLLNPEMNMAEIAENSVTRDANLYKRVSKKLLPSGYEVKRRIRDK